MGKNETEKANDYRLGVDENQIYAEVRVGTVGVASTRLDIATYGDQSKTIAESSIKNGNIPNIFIGKSANLRNCTLLVVSIIDFGNILPENRPSAIKNIVVICTLEGGLPGIKTFSYNSDDIDSSDDGKFFTISISVNLKE